MNTEIPASDLDKKVDELLHMAVRGPVAKALRKAIEYGWQQGREHGLREAEKEKVE